MAPFQDRLTFLPEAILFTILSLIPVKEAARTSVLAKPWRRLWLSRPNVELNDRLFLSPLTGIDEQHPNIEQIRDANKFYQLYYLIKVGFKWFANGAPSISSFSLIFCDPHICPINIENLVRHALYRHPNSLELDFSLPSWEDRLPLNNEFIERFTLPVYVYNYTFLESLKLASCRFDMNNFATIGLTLKSVFLAWIEIINATNLRLMLQSCPLLENLSLSKCFQAPHYDIQSDTLKTIVVDKCVDLLTLTIVAPNLVHLKYCGKVVQFGIIVSENFETAELDFGLVEMFDLEDGEKIANLLDSLYFARSLIVDSYVVQVISFDGVELNPLGQNRAKNLTIKTAFDESEFRGICMLLDNYPLLEEVRFEHGDHVIFREDMEVDYFHVVPPLTDWAKVSPSIDGCLPNMLKVVEIVGLQATLFEMNLLPYLITQAGVLQKLVLRAGNQMGFAYAKGVKFVLAQERKQLKVEVYSEDGVLYGPKGETKVQPKPCIINEHE
ncbi:putative F-box/LRR-repeat protein At5g54820 [Chenopodium quinoa]|uniref:putative F-box/LRR-repeat protein At5g54820 n=1 Tax=Chenopodium quinoa TaxID=63459 RepID=UPI000B786487|nr:putative F-box/LRR-repeat protein At5g54820 [Chenopodium quinoa]